MVRRSVGRYGPGVTRLAEKSVVQGRQTANKAKSRAFPPGSSF